MEEPPSGAAVKDIQVLVITCGTMLSDTMFDSPGNKQIILSVCTNVNKRVQIRN